MALRGGGKGKQNGRKSTKSRGITLAQEEDIKICTENC
jgi:hypothetical protein